MISGHIIQRRVQTEIQVLQFVILGQVIISISSIGIGVVSGLHGMFIDWNFPQKIWKLFSFLSWWGCCRNMQEFEILQWLFELGKGLSTSEGIINLLTTSKKWTKSLSLTFLLYVKKFRNSDLVRVLRWDLIENSFWFLSHLYLQDRKANRAQISQQLGIFFVWV